MISPMTKTTVVLPDIQYPYHDQLMLTKILRVIKDIQPEQILQIGDGIDFPQLSHWSKANAGEFAETLQQHIDGYMSSVLNPVRQAAPDASIVWLACNSDPPIQDFVRT